jgi:predicted glycoside hydrolase/deacetylase ChbG (UPF0249 family)
MKLLKKIKFQADDFGYNKEASFLIFNLKKKKKIINFSCLSNFLKKRREFIKLIEKEKIALHVNLVEGKSISNKNSIYTLVNKKGNFYPLPIFLIKLFFGKIDLDQVYKEIENQIKFLLNNNLIIVELNSHQHIHAFSPIADIFLELAKKYNIKNIRSYKNIYSLTIEGRIKYLITKLFAFISEIIFNKRVGLPKTWEIEDKAKTIFLSWEGRNFDFNRLNDNCYKIIIHPGLPFDKNKKYLKLFNKKYE